MRKLAVLAVGLVGLTLMVAACGGGGNGGVEVAMGGSGGEFAFTPNTLTATVGEALEIALTNEGTQAHSFLIEGTNVSSGQVATGASASVSYTPTQAGTLTFFCDVPGHRGAGMEGTITVS
jgi:plastocyanin